MTGQARISGTELKCLQYSYNLDYLPLDSGLFAGRFAANVFAYSLEMCPFLHLTRELSYSSYKSIKGNCMR